MCSTTFNNNENHWYGQDFPAFYNPAISLAQALLNAMNIYRSKVSQINDNNGVEMTFDEIKTKTIRAAQNLEAMGYKKGQVFGLVAGNSHNVAPITIASIAIGCVVNPLAPCFGKTELIHMFKVTKPVLLFCDIDCYGLINECLDELKKDVRIFTFGGSFGRSKPVEDLFKETQKEHLFIPVKVDGPNDMAFIICTSGTTGFPKGVCVTHATLLDNLSKQSEVSCSSDVLLSFSPLYWGSGLFVLIRGILIGATRIITTEPFTPELQLRLIEKYKVTFSMNPPHQLMLMMKSHRFGETDLSSLRCVVVSGGKVPCQLKTELGRYLPNGFVCNGYGMSEICGMIAYDYPPSNENGVVGKLSDGICIKIIDEDGNRCGLNVEGEIYVKMRNKFLGYFENRKATDEALDNEGFFATGDIGRFNGEGELYVSGRKKELLKYCNFQVPPAEVDAFLIQSPHIKSACVVGIPDEIVGDLPAAAIVRVNGSNITEKDVFDLVTDNFADHYKLRGGVYFVDSFSTTPSGKISRRLVQETIVKLYNARKG